MSGAHVNRLQRFAANAGTAGAIQTLVVVIILSFAMRRDFVTGDWVYTLPILASVVVVAYLIRGFLLENFDWTKWVMNALAVGGLVVYLMTRGGQMGESLWVRLTIAGCIGLYIACYFWVLSDKRIERAR